MHAVVFITGCFVLLCVKDEARCQCLFYWTNYLCNFYMWKIMLSLHGVKAMRTATMISMRALQRQYVLEWLCFQRPAVMVAITDTLRLQVSIQNRSATESCCFQDCAVYSWKVVCSVWGTIRAQADQGAAHCLRRNIWLLML